MHGRPPSPGAPAGRRSPVRASLAVLAFAALLLCGACAAPAAAPPSTNSPSHTPPATATVTPPAPTPRPTATVPPAPPSLTLDAVGDVSLARGVVDEMTTNGPGYPFALVASLIDGDIDLANLEGPLTDGGTPWPKGYNFRTPPRFAPALLAGHFGVVTLANNHIMDYGSAGLTDTIAALDAAGIQHTGAGANALAAHLPVIVTVRGLRVAILGYVATPDEVGGFRIADWAAGDTSPGVAIATPDAITADVTAARRVADFVIVAVHAGDEYRTQPNATQHALADAALAAGADAYIGAHAHVPQPIELRGHQLVAWGLGNFVFALDDADLTNIPPPRVSMILKLTLTKGVGVTSYDVVPVTLNESQSRPRPSTADEAAALHQTIGS